MDGNLTASSRVAIAGYISPAQVAAGTVTTDWLDMANFHSMLALVSVGAFGANATVDAKIEQATSSTGTGAKLVTGRAITQLLAAGGNNKQVAINVSERDLDKTGFRFVRLSVTVGTAATFLSGVLLGMDARYNRASANQSATVVETVR